MSDPSNAKTTGTKKTGLALALAAAAMLSTSATAAGPGTQESKTADVKCYGVNACKGQSDCRTAHSKCSGLNSCRGLGYVGLTARVCEQVGGAERDQEKAQEG